MSKLVVVTAAAFLTLAGAAWAQDVGGTDAPPPFGGPGVDTEAPAGGASEARPGRPPGPPRWMRHKGRHMGLGPDHGMMLRPTRGAMFVFDRGRGEGRIVIKCADQDSTKACADAAQPIIGQFLTPPPAPPAP